MFRVQELYGQCRFRYCIVLLNNATMLTIVEKRYFIDVGTKIVERVRKLR